MLGFMSADIICSEQRAVLREHSSRKTVSFEKQIMSKEKYPSTFAKWSAKWRLLCIILQIFFATRVVLKIEEYRSDIPQF